MKKTFIKLKICVVPIVLLLWIPVEGAADQFAVSFSDSAEHAVLLIIDGLSYKVWDRMNLPVLGKMVNGGVLVERNYLPPAAHPHEGAYAEIHSGSIPNPIMMAGTIFITKETGYLQESFFPSKITAFVANSLAYNTLSLNYHYVYKKNGNDSESITMALRFMEMGHPAFMRIHLQDSGGAGSRSMVTEKDVPWRANIWGDGSPYRTTVERADSLVGEFITGLEKLGVLEKTVIIVMGDHGQNDTGWHPPDFEDSSITSIVLWGAGAKKGVRIPYSEHIDVTPTICALMGVDPPKTSRGRVIAEALAGHSGPLPQRKTLIREMLNQFLEYRVKIADALYMVERIPREKQGIMFVRLNRGVREQFYGIDRFSEWSRFNSIEELLEQNKKALENLDKLIEEIRLLK